jgi:hypothetical protein
LLDAYINIKIGALYNLTPGITILHLDGMLADIEAPRHPVLVVNKAFKKGTSVFPQSIIFVHFIYNKKVYQVAFSNAYDIENEMTLSEAA